MERFFSPTHSSSPGPVTNAQSVHSPCKSGDLPPSTAEPPVVSAAGPDGREGQRQKPATQLCHRCYVKLVFFSGRRVDLHSEPNDASIRKPMLPRSW